MSSTFDKPLGTKSGSSKTSASPSVLRRPRLDYKYRSCLYSTEIIGHRESLRRSCSTSVSLVCRFIVLSQIMATTCNHAKTTRYKSVMYSFWRRGKKETTLHGYTDNS